MLLLSHFNILPLHVGYSYYLSFIIIGDPSHWILWLLYLYLIIELVCYYYFAYRNLAFYCHSLLCNKAIYHRLICLELGNLVTCLHYGFRCFYVAYLVIHMASLSLLYWDTYRAFAEQELSNQLLSPFDYLSIIIVDFQLITCFWLSLTTS